MKTFRPGGLELTQRAAEAIGLCGGQTVLDVGCGTGATLDFLMSRYGVNGYGADISEAAVARAGELIPGARLQVADGCALPYTGEFFDAVFMECTLPLMRKPALALQEAVRVLKPGGYLVVSGLSAVELKEESGTAICDRGRIVESRLRELLVGAGFRMVLCEDENQALVQFLADVYFQYGGIREYMAASEKTLGGCVLNCRVPVRGTSYILLVAQNESCVQMPVRQTVPDCAKMRLSVSATRPWEYGHMK